MFKAKPTAEKAVAEIAASKGPEKSEKGEKGEKSGKRVAPPGLGATLHLAPAKRGESFTPKGSLTSWSAR